MNKGVKQAYPLPRASDMLSRLEEGRAFSKLNVNARFRQVNLDSKSVDFWLRSLHLREDFVSEKCLLKLFRLQNVITCLWTRHSID